MIVRCSGANSCMLYMPIIDLWAIETYGKGSEGNCESSSMESQSCDGQSEVGMENGFCPSADVEWAQSQTVVKKASYLWTTFVEQLESMRVNTSFIILVWCCFSKYPQSLKFNCSIWDLEIRLAASELPI